MRIFLTFLLTVFLLCTSTTVHASTNTPHIGTIDYTCDLSGNAYNNFGGCHSDLGENGATSYAVNGNTDATNIDCSSETGCSARAGGLAVAPICAYGTCVWVDSDSSNAYFVPFRTPNEWSSFINSVQNGYVAGVSVNAAVPPYNGGSTIDIVPPYEGCTGQQTPTPSVYGRSGYSTWSSSPVGPVFNCHQSSTNQAPCYVQSTITWAAEGNPHHPSSCSWTPHTCYGPDLDFSVTANGTPAASVTVTAGSSITLSWNATGATSCQASGGWSGAKPTSGSETLAAGSSNNYTLSCNAPCGVATSATVKVITTSPPSAACGSDANQTLSNTPAHLCANGSTPGAVTATSTGWDWTCTEGSSQKYCSAISAVCLQPTNGQCGNSNGETLASTPTNGFCADGSVPTVTGSGPWYWNCIGENGGSSASCSAQPEPPPQVCGTCGSANGVPVATAPTTNLCSTGTASATAGTGPWNWYCYGANGGTTVSCSAPLQPSPVCGICGSANGETLASAPTTNLCSAGTAQTVNVTASGWSWSCNGVYGGTNASCAANLQPPTNGQCGSSNGASLTSAPMTNLCSLGTASSVSGSGPWSWTCSGTYGGTTASCAAQLQNIPVNGQCGSSNGMTGTSAPTTGLCSAGTASTVGGTGPWNWTCSGSYGGTNASCSENFQPPVCGECGSANGETTSSAPTTGLCSVGTPSAVGGMGPWNWTCSGSYGGTPASCSAQPPAPPPINGQCATVGDGTVWQLVRAGTPQSLCIAGNVININLPIRLPTWTCQGINGGSNANCSAVYSPLVLDLSGAGLDILNLEQSHAHFDMLNDGKPVHTAWIGPKSAFLVLDRNGTGVINDRLDMFGDMRGAANGFQDLALLDSNGDGVIDAKDPMYSKLMLWIDKNGDGISQPGELYTLPQLGIASISLKAKSLNNEVVNGQLVSDRAEFTYTNGKKGNVYDVWFQAEP